MYLPVKQIGNLDSSITQPLFFWCTLIYIQGGPKKWHILFQNFGKSASILTILSLLQQFC